MKPTRICSINECASPTVGRGWCRKHYERWRRLGDAAAEVRGVRPPSTGPCSIEGCGGEVKSRGWCVLHYERWRRRGDPLALTVEPIPDAAVCTGPDCVRRPRSKGLCNAHYMQRLAGSALTPIRGRPSKRSPRQRAYDRWRQMLYRCTNPENAAWENYGGRGIEVCESWMDFETYYADVGDPPERGMSLDRIDNDGNYEPSNVRWATDVQQAKNRRPATKRGGS